MYKLYVYNYQKPHPPICFDDKHEAELYAKLLFRFNTLCWLTYSTYEYDAATGEWENFAY